MLRTVKTENGWVEGIPAADPRITAFKGIPFAAPPVGERRWKAPQPAENWDGVRKCYTFGPLAMQEIPGLNPDNLYSREWHVDPEVEMSEDCLQLNIWTNAKTGDEKMPVMVWFYGGGLTCGYPSEMEFDGERIARRGVVLVSVNYRVNVFGFLAHPELTAEAEDGLCTNFGNLDQRYGLLWVKRNIASFGGDPDNITIFGQSAGGRSTLFQLLSPMNDTDTIKKAISMSGGGINFMSPMRYPALEEAEKNGEAFFSYLGVKTLAEARAIDAVTIRDKMLSFKGLRWGTVVDGTFLTDDPAKLLAQNKRLPVPLMAGHTTGDMGDMFARTPDKQTMKAQIETLAGDGAQQVLDLVDFEHKSLEELKADFAINSQRFGVELLQMRGAMADLPMYFYRFGPEIPGWDDPGAFHSSDLWFVFETLAKCWRPFVGKHYDLARQMCNYFTNFAKTGDPNGADADGSAMPEWKAFTKESPYSMDFLDTAALGTEDELPAVRLLLEKTAEKYFS